jgi:hypothetical protein
MQVIDTFNQLRRPLSAVGIAAIPEQHPWPPQFLVQMPGEIDDLQCADLRLGMQAKVRPHPVSAGGHTGQRGPIPSRDGVRAEPTPASSPSPLAHMLAGLRQHTLVQTRSGAIAPPSNAGRNKDDPRPKPVSRSAATDRLDRDCTA